MDQETPVVPLTLPGEPVPPPPLPGEANAFQPTPQLDIEELDNLVGSGMDEDEEIPVVPLILRDEPAPPPPLSGEANGIKPTPQLDIVELDNLVGSGVDEIEEIPVVPLILNDEPVPPPLSGEANGIKPTPKLMSQKTLKKSTSQFGLEGVSKQKHSSWLDDKLALIQDTGEEEEVERNTIWQKITQSKAFDIATALLICINGVLMGIETDHGDGGTGWEVIEAIFLFAYTVELLIRLKADGFTVYKHDNWIRFDTAVLLIAYLDTCIISPVLKGGDSGPQKIAMLLRMMRLMKLTRLIRLLRFFKELWLLVASFGSAFKTLAWTFVLLILVLYVFGIMFVKVLGKETSDEDIQEWFGSLPGAMFTLFQIMTLENWAEIARTVWDTDQWYMTFTILFFIGISSFAIMNTVMAVIVEHTLGEAMKQKDDLIKEAERELHASANTLFEMFKAADNDKSGALSKDEYVNALTDNKSRKLLQELDLGEDFGCLDAEEVGILFETIDIDGSNELSPQEFVDGMMQMRGTARARRLFELQCNLEKLRRSVSLSQEEQRIDLEQRIEGLHLALEKQATSQQALEAKVDDKLSYITSKLNAIGGALGVED